MSDRERLPGRRFSFRVKFFHQQIRYYASVGLYPDGRPGEVFLTGGKIGSSIEPLSRDAAILLSFALQHGADWRAIRDALCRDREGNPEGPIGVLLDRLEQDLAELEEPKQEEPDETEPL